MMEMTSKDVRFWYKIYEKQMAKKSVIDEYSSKGKEVPQGILFTKKVNRKILEWNGGLNE